jgi:oligopeptide transport system substrate-binding protein
MSSRSLLAALALGLLAASPLAAPAAAQVVFNRGNDADPETRDLYEGLVIHNNKGEVVPGVAESWTVSDDGRTYRFTLRANAKWSNGDPVRASDFVYSYRRLMNPETGAKYANLLYPLRNAEKVNKKTDGAKLEDLGARAVDDRTLELTLEQPTPYFIELLTHQTGLPVHPASVEKHGNNFVRPENWVSNGAYVLKSVVPNDHIRLEKNPNFHDAANVQIDVVRVIPHKDLAAAVRRFEAGELHFTTDLPADQIKRLRQQFGSQVNVSPYLGTWYYAFNTSKKPYDDVRVRTALSMTIDREFIAEQIWGETMIPAYGFVPPGIGNYGTPAEAEWKALSPIEREDRAKALLAEAGFGPQKPLKVQVRYNTTDNNRNTVVAIADMWKAIGVQTEFVNTDAKTHFAVLRDTNDFEIARAGWIGDYSDPHNFLFLFLSDNTGFNYARWKSPQFDELMRRAAAETDLKARAALLLEADKMTVKEQPYAPILFYSTKNLVSPKLKGFHPNLRGAFPTRFMRIEG